jgi:hypothetical protein
VKKRFSPWRSDGTVKVGPEKSLFGKRHIQAVTLERGFALRRIEGDFHQ